MRIEALKFKNGDKTEIAIYVLLCDSHTKNAEWRIDDIWYRPYRKKNWVSYRSELSDSYEYRHLDYEDRTKYLNKKYEEFVGKDMLEKAYIAAWESLKPDIEELLNN